jgi:hypothetical protein
MELFALVHDSGAGGGAGPVSDHYVGRLMEKVAMKLLDAPCTRAAQVAGRVHKDTRSRTFSLSRSAPVPPL